MASQLPNTGRRPARTARHGAHRLRLLLVTPCLAAVLATSAAATTWRPMDFAGLCQRSDVVVLARAVGATASRGDDGWIRTTYELEVLEQAMPPGAPAGRLTVEQFGGQIGDERHYIHGVAPIPMGEPLVLFLADVPRRGLVPVNGPQGTLRVVDGEIPGLGALLPGAAARDVAELLSRVRDLATRGPRR